MAALGDLSSELLRLIVEQLYVDDAPLISLRMVNLVCHTLHEIASPLLFRRISLNFANAEGLADYLLARDVLKLAVREVDISIPADRITRRFQQPVLRLLPALSNLECIRLSAHREFQRLGSTSTFELSLTETSTHEKNEGTAFSTQSDFWEALFSSIRAIDRPVSLHISDCLDESAPKVCHQSYGWLKSVHVAVVDPEKDYACPPSQTLGPIFSRLQNLEHLHLQLRSLVMEWWPRIGNQFREERENALTRLVPHQRSIRSLIIDGDFDFSHAAWQKWGEQFHWNQLDKLSLRRLTLITQVADRIWTKPLSVTTLKLHAYGALYTAGFPQEPASLKPFLSSLSLRQLCLSGFHPDTLMDYVNAKGSKLQRIRFHFQRWLPPARCPVPLVDELMLSVEHITKLKELCPRLEWLGLDVSVRSLVQWTIHSQEPQQHALLDAIAKLRAVRHVRCFVDDGQRFGLPMSKQDVLATFEYLRSRKLGYGLESLVVCCLLNWKHVVYAVIELGPTYAVLDHRSYSLVRTIEVWDTKRMAQHQDSEHLLDRRSRNPKAWTIDTTWGIPEGW